MHSQEPTTGEICPKSASHDSQGALSVTAIINDLDALASALTYEPSPILGTSQNLDQDLLTVTEALIQLCKIVSRHFTEGQTDTKPTFYPARLEAIEAELKAVLGDMPQGDKNTHLVEDARLHVSIALSNIKHEIEDSGREGQA